MLASAAALVAVAACCSSASAIIGGGPVTIAQHPYQAALVWSDDTAPAGQYCGGVIRDSLHVITAAHCVFDTPRFPGRVLAPSEVDVLAGVTRLDTESATTRRDVAKISFDPSYNSGTFENDAALLTLTTPIILGTTAQPISLIDDAAWAALPPNSSVFVSGWGTTTAPPASASYPDDLRGVAVKYITDSDCQNLLFGTTAPTVQVCAADTGKDSCNGDSGGPLVRTVGASTPGDDRLIGIVSAGYDGCAKSWAPGLYTEVAQPSIRSFLLEIQAVAAPINTSQPALSGQVAVGGRLICSAGVWTGSPSFRYRFVRSNAAGADVGVASDGDSPAYVITKSDAGSALRCVVSATNAGGTTVAESARTGTLPGEHGGGGSTNLDRNAPVARVTRTKCSSSKCTLTVSVSDIGYSAGIKTVQASVRTTYKTKCRRKGRRVSCTKTKTGHTKVKKLAATRFQVSASKLPVGKQVFTLYAVDKAGHRQALATKKTVTTKKKKKSKKRH